MNLDELQSVQSRERQTDSLQQLRESFYQDAGEYLRELRTERERAAERADDPFDSPEVNRLTDDIKTAERTVEALYERRVGKIVKMASLAAADMPTEEEGLTREERSLFDTLVSAIEDSRETVLDVLEGEAAPGTVATGQRNPRSESGPATDPGTNASPAHDEGAPVEPPASEENVGNTPAADPDSEPATADRDTEPATANRDPEPATADPDGPGPTVTEATGEPSTQEGPGAGGPADGPDVPPTSAGDDSPDVGAADVMGDVGDDAAAAAGEDPGRSGDAFGDGDEPDPSAGLDNGYSAGGEATDDADQEEGVERATVRITDEVGSILGVDEREYDLSADDVVTLPESNAEPLVEQDAAERIS